MDDDDARSIALWFYGAAVLVFLIVAWSTTSTLLVPQPAGLPTGWPFDHVASAIGLAGSSITGRVVALVTSEIALSLAYVFVLLSAWRGRVSTAGVGLACVLVHAVILFGPIIYSRDVFSYAMYGRIAAIYGHNPYQVVPSAFLSDPVFGFVGGVWRDSVPVYGPASTWYGILITRWSHDPATEIVWFRSVSVLASLGTVAFIWATTRALAPSRSAFAMAAYGLSPVVGLLTAASGHNDVLLALSGAAGVWLLIARRPVLSTSVLTIGTLVKLTGGVTLLIGSSWRIGAASDRASARRRTLQVFAAVVVTTCVLAVPLLSRSDPTLGQTHLIGHEGWLAIPRVISTALSAFVGDNASAFVVRWIFFAAWLTSIIWVASVTARGAARRADPLDVAAGCGVALLLTILLIPANLPWYMVWVLPFAWVVPQRIRFVIIGLACVQFLSLPVADEALFPGAFDATARVANNVLAPAMILVVVIVVADVIRRLRSPAMSLVDEEIERETPAASADPGTRS